MKYRVFLNDEPMGWSDHLSVAQAAWDRAGRDRDIASQGAEAVLMIDGHVVASVPPKTAAGIGWPVGDDHITDLRDVAKSVLQLARVAGVPAQALADEMTAQGLPTTASRLKSISTIEQGRRSTVSSAELVTVCYAAVAVIKRAQASEPSKAPTAP